MNTKLMQFTVISLVYPLIISGFILISASNKIQFLVLAVLAAAPVFLVTLPWKMHSYTDPETIMDKSKILPDMFLIAAGFALGFIFTVILPTKNAALYTLILLYVYLAMEAGFRLARLIVVLFKITKRRILR